MRSSKQPAALDTDTDDFPHRGRPSPWTKPLYSYDTLLQCSQWVPFRLFTTLFIIRNLVAFGSEVSFRVFARRSPTIELRLDTQQCIACATIHTVLGL
jgi:hypothetical protein